MDDKNNKKPSELKKFFSNVFSNKPKDAIKDAFFNVGVPQFKSFLRTIGIATLDSILYKSNLGGPKTQYKQTNYNGYSSYSYNQPYQQNYNQVPQYQSQQGGVNIAADGRRIYGVLDVHSIPSFIDITEANNVLLNTTEWLRRYRKVSVGKFYEFARLRADSQTNEYGWYNLDDAVVVSDGNGGYTIQLPKPERLI